MLKQRHNYQENLPAFMEVLSNNDNIYLSNSDVHAIMVAEYSRIFSENQKPIHRSSMYSSFTPLSVPKRLHLELKRGTLKSTRWFKNIAFRAASLLLRKPVRLVS